MQLLFLLLASLCWGPSYLFIKFALKDFSPMTLVFFRLLSAAIILWGFCFIQKERMRPHLRHWKEFLLIGILANALPFFLISKGELYISSALAGILNSTTLIFTALFAHFFGRHDPLTHRKVMGIVLGLIGLCIIYLPIALRESITSQLGVILLVGSSCSYAAGSVYARMHLHKAPILIMLMLQLFSGALVLLPFALIFEPFPTPTLASSGSILALALLGTVGGFFFFYKTMQVANVTYASFSVLIVPIFAMILGELILHEALTWNLYLGALFILIGILAVNQKSRASP